MWFVRAERLAEINCDFFRCYIAVLFVFAAAQQQQNQTGGRQGRRGSDQRLACFVFPTLLPCCARILLKWVLVAT